MEDANAFADPKKDINPKLRRKLKSSQRRAYPELIPVNHIEPHTVYSYRTGRALFGVFLGLLVGLVGALFGVAFATGHISFTRAPAHSPNSPEDFAIMLGIFLFSLLAFGGAIFSALACLNSKIMVGEGHMMCFDWRGSVKLNSQLEDVTTHVYAYYLSPRQVNKTRRCTMTSPSGRFQFTDSISNYNDLIRSLRASGKAGHTDELETALA